MAATPAPLTVVADDQVAAFGADPPPLSASYLGFVNGEGPASLDRLATLTTTAAAYSPPGRYPITASGAASPDYAVAFVDGTLTVAQPTSPRLRRHVRVVTTLYRRSLGRPAEPAGLRFWLGRLDAGTRAEDVARRIWTSPEHRARIRRVDAWQGASRIEP
ncbi:MBG domain-containing protein [Planctomyces sp. SH-PL62]|uniref:MBG domain-containing protein n=1 Tax=Planctomyces sp. SH-PL62 TaxID=1636152 RepID=UPI0012E84370|nr:MBG domain-containing protein [Planctomyces sp. SH-PL62]